MINLLPPSEKQKLLKERALGEVLILGIVFFSALVCLALVLLFIKVNLESKLLFQRAILSHREREFENSEAKRLEQEILSLNKTLSGIDSLHKRKVCLIDIFTKLSETIPNDVVLTNISYEKDGQELSLSGFSATREHLLEFKGLLEQEFKDIFFPTSSWVSSKDINFLVSFKLR